MKITAFSGLTNTGKSTEIKNIGDELTNGRIVMNETARDLFDLLPSEHNGIDDMTLFQMAISAKEKARLYELLKIKERGIAKNVIVDRPYYDSVLFNEFNRSIGTSKLEDSNFIDFSDELYDTIVLFSSPFKDNSRLSIYNSDDFEKMFINGVKERYGDKVIEFPNAADPDYKLWRDLYFGL